MAGIFLGGPDQQRWSPLRKYFIPVCVGRVVRLGLRVCPAAPAAFGNLVCCPIWDRGRKTRFSNGLAHNRAKVSGSWAEIDGVHINLRDPSSHVCQKHLRVAVFTDWELGSCSRI